MAEAGARKRRDKSAGSPGFLARLGRIGRDFLLGPDADEPPSDRVQEIKGLLLAGLSVWLFLALLTFYHPFGDPGASGRNWGGRIGFYLALWTQMGVGLAGWLVCWLGGTWGAILVARKRVSSPLVRAVGGLCFVVSLAFLLQMAFGDTIDPSNHLPYGVGGWIAMSTLPVLQDKFGGPGLWVLMPLLALVSFMLATEMAFYPSLVALREWAEKRQAERGETFGAALASWSRQLVGGLWDFLRGAPVESVQVIEPAPAKRRKAARDESSDDDEPALAPSKRAKVAADDEGADDDEDEIAPRPASAKKTVEVDDAEEDDELVAAPTARVLADDDDELDGRDGDDDAQSGDEDDVEPAAATRKGSPRVSVKKSGAKTPVAERPTPPSGPWKLPPLDLLEPPERDFATDNRVVTEAAMKLENALKSFRVEANVVGAQVGPTVILFELEVAQGTRLNKVTQLSQEIAAALRAQSVRIIAPIPGKATIGIEVPNVQRRKVRISELVSQRAYDGKQIALPLFLGMDVEGNAIVDDLAKMPHLLIAGTTGSGKSVCINTILASLLLTRSPHDVQAILIDPKMVELQMFANIPHLMLPVVTDMRQATNVLAWAVEKMEGRYELFNQAAVRNIKGYNALSEDELKQRMGEAWSDERTPRHVPYIVVVIDEFADLMMQSKKEAEQAITRLAQKSRAVGIHVILATQRPSTDVITGVIKGNLPTRIAFQVASKVDSRVILDAMGAEKLLGGGDMLYNPPQSSKIKRVQGALVEDHELQKLVDFVCQESAPSFSQELIQAATGSARPGGDDASGFESALEDDLWDEAVRIILKSKRGSASLLQRALGIGYTRASRLLDMMGEAGIVSDHKGSKAREVLMTLEQWEAEHGAPSGQGAQGANDE